MNTENSIRLRLRFYKDIDENIEVVRQKFVDYSKVISPDFLMKIRNNHIQFTIKGEKQRYWSPYLSVELEEKEGNEKNATHIRGLFGPAQTMWTFFIFLHFIIAGIFLTFLMFAFSDYALNQSIVNDVIIMISMVICWILLYVIARQTRANGYGQMEELERECQKIIG
ncbi:hypothetical protein [Flavobacterium sp.]|uniref:hypothetical protein n=1 Tax=Flavobacterium sp. TaxID=239 RepID=UPI002B4AD6C7|nr:hypothetical protein [Flavobacterium sp.]HLP65516.1 hypothetical protein [Flavobacterium sp.]